MKKQILVAASLAPGRDAAFSRALTLARKTGSELYILHAVPKARYSTRAVERLEIRRELLERARQAAVTATAVEQQGDAAKVIDLHATSRGVDLIVMGAEREAGPRWLRRPTVAERVLSRTTVPTLIVPTDDQGEDAYEHLLIGVDLSPASTWLVQRALQLSAGDSPRVTLVHSSTTIEDAAAVSSPARWTVPEYRTYVLEQARREMEEVVAEIPGLGDAGVHVATGSAAKAIAEHADTVGADLIVVGSTRRFKPLGSTARRILAEDRRALLVVPVAAAAHHAAVADAA